MNAFPCRPLRGLIQVTVLLVLVMAACRPAAEEASDSALNRLPTGVVLDPAGASFEIGQLPLAMVTAPEGDRVVLLLNGWREQGIQVVNPATREVVQTLLQPAAFLGLAFAPDGQTLYASGGNQDVIYRYSWQAGEAALVDSLVLAAKAPNRSGTRYPSGLALSPDGRFLYVGENLADSLAVVDLAQGRVVQRLASGRYPYGVAVASDGTVYVSSWGADDVRVYAPTSQGRLAPDGAVPVARHPSALLLGGDDTRLFVTSGSTDRISVVDTETRRVLTDLIDAAPAGPSEGSTPNALALSSDGTRLFVAEADNNAVAVFDLSPSTSGVASAGGEDLLVGRIPSGWYPTALAVQGGDLLVASGKGLGAGSNADEGPQPGRRAGPRGYTLGQYAGVLTVVEAKPSTDALAAYTERVAQANGWGVERTPYDYPPFEHVIYIIKENRTYDQIFGDLPEGDGDTSLVFFPRRVSPNHHALAERFGLYDRFLVNAEVSPDGHNWSVGAYTTDYLQKTVPSLYSGRGRSYDYAGLNRGERPPDGDDAAEPANGYLWDLAQRKGISFRNFGEFVIPEDVDPDDDMPPGYRGLKPFLEAHTDPDFPGYDLSIADQRRADVWIAALEEFVERGSMPALQIIRLPNDHTRGARPGALTPSAYMADNDLALGRVVEALSKTSFWASTAVFVVEDDSQNGPDHVDSHRAPFLAISPYNRPGVYHRFTNTTDVLATMEEILGLGQLSQFDYYGRPLRAVFADAPDLSPYTALLPEVSLEEVNPEEGPGVAESMLLDFRFEDLADEDTFNRALWLAIKGPSVPYPGIRRISGLDLKRGL